jgi:8-hydroxy-5-deazaflavin:NADPH oxidoreductase
MKKIGILGSGNVAQTLGAGFIKYGYEVMLGSREPSKLNEWKNSTGGKAKLGTFQETAEFGELIVFALKGTAAKEVVKLCKELLAHKTVIDTTNPIADTAPENGVLLFFTNINKSLMEELQDISPKANFVKAFSCIGSYNMINPAFESKPSMFICGNSEDAKSEVKEILDKFGFETEDMGTAQAARAIEPLSMLWCIPGFQKNDWNHALKMMR